MNKKKGGPATSRPGVQKGLRMPALTPSPPDGPPETLAIFDMRLPGVSDRLHRERAVWREDVDLETVDQAHYTLILRADEAQRLAA